MPLDSRRTALLSDTVGFIRKLPPHLVAAFRATLEELEEARLHLHVTDASDPQRAGQDAAVEALLEELGVAATPRLHVWNKVDLLVIEERHRLEAEDSSVTVSAQTGEGLENLRQRIADKLSPDPVVEADFEFSSCDGKQLALLHQSGTVVSTRYEADRVLVRAKVPESLREKLRASTAEPLRER
jgi:GTP-binding protein HflX